MRRGGKHNQCVGTRCEPLGQLGTLRATTVIGPVGNILRLVDHNDVPIGSVECRTILNVALQRIDGDDYLVVVRERIGVRRNFGTNLLDAGGIQADQRNGESLPHFLLELNHHAFGRHHKNAAAFTTLDELRHQYAGLQGLAEANRVGNENTLTRLGKRFLGRNKLIRQRIHGGLIADVNLVVGRSGCS